MSETIEITTFEKDFKKRVLTITDTTEPSTPNLTIINKQNSPINVDIRVGFDISFIESGKIKFLTKDSQFLLNDNDLNGIQDLSSGTILLKKDDKIDLSMWNIDGGTFSNIVLIFINSKSDGTFVDPLALLEITTKSSVLLNVGTPIASSPFTKNFSMDGFKNLNLTLGTNMGFPLSSILRHDSWANIGSAIDRDTIATTVQLSSVDKEIVLDCGEEITGKPCFIFRTSGALNGIIGKLEYSIDDSSYTEVINENISNDTTVHGHDTDVTFRYLRFTALWTTGSSQVQFFGFGLKNFLAATVVAKIQTSEDGLSWNDFIIDTEFDTSLLSSDEDAESYLMGRFNASNTGVFYLFPQGTNKLRIHLTLTAYGTYIDTGNFIGYGGKVTVDKLS